VGDPIDFRDGIAHEDHPIIIFDPTSDARSKVRRGKSRFQPSRLIRQNSARGI
jgi:hypothetical protein